MVASIKKNNNKIKNLQIGVLHAKRVDFFWGEDCQSDNCNYSTVMSNCIYYIFI